MYICFAGKIVSLDGKNVSVKNDQTGETIECKFTGDDAITKVVGDEGIFLGNYVNGQYLIHSFNLQQFLDPLYEKEAVELGAAYNLVTPIDDPFPDIYLEI